MRSPSPSRVLIVAQTTAASSQLAEAVARRAKDGPCVFTLLVPARSQRLRGAAAAEGPGQDEAESQLSAALPLLSEAAGHKVIGVIGCDEPFVAIQDALNILGFDEVIISMLPARISRWLHRDLTSKVRATGVRVTEVIAAESRSNPVSAA